MDQPNQRVVLTRPLQGMPEAGDFAVADAPCPDPGPGHFLRLMRGDNVGKALVVLGDEKGG